MTDAIVVVEGGMTRLYERNGNGIAELAALKRTLSAERAAIFAAGVMDLMTADTIIEAEARRAPPARPPLRPVLPPLPSGDLSRLGGKERRKHGDGSPSVVDVYRWIATRPDGVTVRDIARHFGWTVTQANSRVTRLRREGLLDRHKISGSKEGRFTVCNWSRGGGVGGRPPAPTLNGASNGSAPTD